MDFMKMLAGYNDTLKTDEMLEAPVAMTIAGSDSGGGAGLQADLKVFAANRVHGTSVVTLITAQNTQGVQGVFPLPEHVVRAQFQSVVQDLKPVAAKLGALGHERIMGTVVECLQERALPKLVIDPVMVSKHGEPLMDEGSQSFMRDRVLEHALIVTPNRYEAMALTGREVEDLTSMKDAAKRIYDFGAKYVLLKGSHLGRIVRDILYDGTGFIEFGADYIRTQNVHGAGCVLSAAITARLAHGDEVVEAVEFARQFISSAISASVEVGQGIQPVNPMFSAWKAM